VIETRFSGRGHRRCGDGRCCKEFKLRVNVWTVHWDAKGPVIETERRSFGSQIATFRRHATLIQNASHQLPPPLPHFLEKS